MNPILDATLIDPADGDATHLAITDRKSTDLGSTDSESADCESMDLAPPAKPITIIEPRVSVTVRAGTLADLSFIDRLQKANSRELGFLPTMALEGKIQLGQVLVAVAATGIPIGYLIAADRYFKRDEIGYVTQINVLPEYRRHLVAATLLQAQFDRSAYGCRLYCCWCAQDLKANAFWEAMGFTAIAFRTGSRTKGRDANGRPTARIHLFWQKRVRAGDTGDPSRDGPGGGTPWWYPAQTAGGEMREDRLVFPIPPGVHWRDVLPIVLPETANASIKNAAINDGPLALPAPVAKKIKKPKAPAAPKPDGALWFGNAGKTAMTEEDRIARHEAKKLARAEAAARVDPRLTAMARELRDRWSETAINLLSMPGKYDLQRTLGEARPHVPQSHAGRSHAAGPAIDALPFSRPALPLAA